MVFAVNTISIFIAILVAVAFLRNWQKVREKEWLKGVGITLIVFWVVWSIVWWTTARTSFLFFFTVASGVIGLWAWWQTKKQQQRLAEGQPLLVTLSKGDYGIVDRWSTVIVGGSGKAPYVLEKIQQLLKGSEAPGVKWQMVEAQPGVIKGFFGKKREYLAVTNETLWRYAMLIGARDYGINLDVSWFLTARIADLRPLPFTHQWKKVMAYTNPERELERKTDFIEEQELRAYVTTVHQCVLEVVKEIKEQLGQDVSQVRMNTRSKGFLEVW